MRDNQPSIYGHSKGDQPTDLAREQIRIGKDVDRSAEFIAKKGSRVESRIREAERSIKREELERNIEKIRSTHAEALEALTNGDYFPVEDLAHITWQPPGVFALARIRDRVEDAVVGYDDGMGRGRPRLDREIERAVEVQFFGSSVLKEIQFLLKLDQDHLKRLGLGNSKQFYKRGAEVLSDPRDGNRERTIKRQHFALCTQLEHLQGISQLSVPRKSASHSGDQDEGYSVGLDSEFGLELQELSCPEGWSLVGDSK